MPEIYIVNSSMTIKEKARLLFKSIVSVQSGKLLACMLMLVTGLLLALSFLLVTTTGFAGSAKANASVRVKDIVAVEGIRDNILVGYGLVVGLNGTGDKINNTGFTEKALFSFLERLGINAKDQDLKVKNVASVTVTAVLPPFARVGSKIDLTVSTLGDAKSLQGGILLVTPLLGADGEVYAVGQGPITVAGFSAGGKAETVSKGVPTSGFISAGAIIEKEVAFDLNTMSELKLAIRNPDVGTATAIEKVINEKLNDAVANAIDPGTVVLQVPEEYRDSVTSFLASIEQLEIVPDQKAKIIIDESSGTIVMNQNVKLNTVAIAQGNLVVRIKESAAVSQPPVLSGEGAETVVVPQTEVSVDESSPAPKLTILEQQTNLRDLVNGLNALGIGPRDMITILQTIKSAGALHAEIETR